MDYAKTVRDYFFKYKQLTKGSISLGDGQFIADTLSKYSPAVCLDLGVASGLSSGLMLTLMEASNPNFRLVSVDFSDTYYIDPTKKVGFLLDTTNPNPNCQFELHLGCWAADLPKLLGDEKIDVAFIDAMHRHPWTLIDLMLTLPQMRSPGVIMLHDICLYQNEKWRHGIGPHYVYEGLDEKKWKSDEASASIGAIEFQRPIQSYEADFLKILNQPWTIDDPIPANMVTDLLARLATAYSPGFVHDVTAQFERRNATSTQNGRNESRSAGNQKRQAG